MDWDGLISGIVCVRAGKKVSAVSPKHSMKARQSQYFAVKPSLCIPTWTCLAVVVVEICGSWDALMFRQGANVFTCLSAWIHLCPLRAGRRRAVGVWFKLA